MTFRGAAWLMLLVVVVVVVGGRDTLRQSLLFSSGGGVGLVAFQSTNRTWLLGRTIFMPCNL